MADLDPRRLLILEVVARLGSISAAARELRLSQPAVSRHVAHLELTVGVPLLERDRSGVRPTPAGQALVERAAAVREELQTAAAVAGAFAEGSAGAVRVASFPSAAAALVAPAFRRLRERAPEVRVSLREAGRTVALRLLREAEVDVAIVFEPIGEEDAWSRLDAEELFEESFLLALPEAHSLAGRKRISLAALRDGPWIVGSDPSMPGLIERACIAAGFLPDVVARADDQPTIQALVAAGVGVTLIPELAAVDARSDLVLRHVHPAPVRRRILAVTRRAPAAAPAVGSFVQELRGPALAP